MNAVAGLLLAAGAGSRLGRPKAVVEVGGVRLVDRGVAMLRGGGLKPVVVVLGAAATEVQGAVIVRNPYWRSGMGSSLRVGLASLPESADAVVVALVDQPLVGAEVIRRLSAAYGSGAGIAVASYGGAPRNPVLLRRDYWSRVAQTAVGDVGARPFLRANPALVAHVECGDIADPADVDTPADLDELADERPRDVGAS